MKKLFFIFTFNWIVIAVCAQNNNADSAVLGTVTINKDARIETLGKKMAEYNESLSNKLHPAKGYRLMVLSTNNRDEAFQVRSQLLQLFPDHSVYMIFQSPYIKLKFGNFLDKSEADDFRNQINALKIVTRNIYIIPEMVVVKGDKLNQTDE